MSAREDARFTEMKLNRALAEEEKRLRLQVDESDEEEVAALERQLAKRRRRDAAVVAASRAASAKAEAQTPPFLLSERLEVLQLDGNRIEHIPDNLFSSFSCLRELRLAGNPLKDPPAHAVGISGGYFFRK